MKICKSQEVICYVCGIVDDNIKDERSIKFNNSAAENKVLGICNALKPHVKQVVVISAGRGGELKNGSHFPAVVRRVSNVVVLYGSFRQVPVVTHFITAFSLVVLMIRVMKNYNKKHVSVIAYNRKWHYIPLLCLARIWGVRCVLDLEDGSQIHKGSIKSRFASWFSKLIIDNLCDRGALLASSLLSEQVNHKRQYICHGVAYLRQVKPASQESVSSITRILFGGSLLKETGAQLLIDCVLKLEKEHQDIQNKIKFVVTGFGPMAENLQALSSGSGKNWIEYHGSVDVSNYREILDGVHVAMCLKLPSTEMGATTFPSKVVEFASFGKAVVTTRVEDVVQLFGEDGAYILEDESVESLINIILRIALEADAIDCIARRGQARLLEKASKHSVASGIMNLLFSE